MKATREGGPKIKHTGKETGDLEISSPEGLEKKVMSRRGLCEEAEESKKSYWGEAMLASKSVGDSRSKLTIGPRRHRGKNGEWETGKESKHSRKKNQGTCWGKTDWG